MRTQHISRMVFSVLLLDRERFDFCWPTAVSSVPTYYGNYFENARFHLLGSKKTMALRQANSVSSICTSFSGLTSSSKTRDPTLLMSKSDGIPLSATRL